MLWRHKAVDLASGLLKSEILEQHFQKKLLGYILSSPSNPISHSASVDTELRCTKAFWQILLIAAGVKSSFSVSASCFNQGCQFSIYSLQIHLKKMQNGFITFSVMSVLPGWYLDLYLCALRGLYSTVCDSLGLIRCILQFFYCINYGSLSMSFVRICKI